MLTVMLLVVLGGGVGLLAVWMVDPGSLRRFAGRTRSLRAASGGGTAPEPGSDPVVAAPDATTGPVATPPPAPEPTADAPAPAPAPRLIPSGTGTLEVVAWGTAGPTTTGLPASSPRGPGRRRRRAGVPVQFTAVEGSWRDVAATPLWRKVLSSVLLLVVLFGAGIALAAIAAATLGVVAELVDRAIG